jgi:4'-phosphopantetheinyl transferase
LIASREALDVIVREQVGAHQVYWRLGAIPGATPGALSSIAREWLEQLVRSSRVFTWRGLTAENSTGKPLPVGAPRAAVSISHSGPLVLVGACADARLGVDIEAPPFDAFDSPQLVRRMCTPAESGGAASLAHPDRRRYLARVWTTKEAFVKATGSGLATDFRTLESGAALHASPQPFEAHVAVIDDRDRTTFRRLILEENHV